MKNRPPFKPRRTFAAKPKPAPSPHRPPPIVTPAVRAWWEVLAVPRSAGRDEIEAAFKRAAKAAHPDLGGSEAAMREVNAARAAALEDQSV